MSCLFTAVSVVPEWSCSKTLQKTEARFISNFGWGLTKRIESHSLARFKANVQRVCATTLFPAPPPDQLHQSREGVSLVLGLIRQARMQPMTFGGSSLSFLESHRFSAGWNSVPPADDVPHSNSG